MKKPDDELVKQIIILVMKKRKHVETQEELEKLVLSYLRRLDPDFIISPQKMRFLALGLPEIESRVRTKSSTKSVPDSCPACGGELELFKAKNLLGEDVVVAFKCSCGYAGTSTSFAPAQYEFFYRETF